MFKLSENYEIDRRILKCDFIRYSPAKISTINTAISQIYFNIPREDSVISLLNSYLELNFDVLQATTNNRYVDANDIRLVNLGAIALFSNYKLTTSSGKHLEEISHVHIVSLMYKLLTSSKIVMICLLVLIVIEEEEKTNYLIIKVLKANIILEFI